MTLLEGRAIPSRCLIWLDDIQDTIRFITASLIRRVLVIPKVVVVATMRATEYDRYAPKESITPAPDYDRLAFASGREVLSLATTIRMDRRFSDSERSRVRKYVDDPRIAEAAARLSEFGLAEYLAAGPRLLDRWRNAWDVGGHPTGAAIVAAAVDCRRAGLRAPLSNDLLYELYLHYLEEHGGARLRPESFQEGLDWATERVHATSSLLVPSSDIYGAGHCAFDYLVDTVERDPTPPPIPFVIWGAMLAYAEATTAAVSPSSGVNWQSAFHRRSGERVSTENIFQLGVQLQRHGNVSEAARWFRKAAKDGHGSAAFRLASIENDIGKLDDAEYWYRRAAKSGHIIATYRLGELCYKKHGIAAARAIWDPVISKAMETRLTRLLLSCIVITSFAML